MRLEPAILPRDLHWRSCVRPTGIPCMRMSGVGGATPDDARDLTQGFFTSLIERRDFDSLQKERGRFRAFLLASLQHYLANDFARRTDTEAGWGNASTLP